MGPIRNPNWSTSGMRVTLSYLLKYVTIVNQNGESSKSTKRKTTDHQQEKIKEYEKNRTRKFLPKWTVGRPWLRNEANGMVCTPFCNLQSRA
jgi:hypothetical protein